MMNSDLQNKMYHFEADPPKEVWNKIADALDAESEQSFPQRLYSYEEQPSSTIWNKIETALEETEPSIKVVPITRFKKPLRYVAAAASIIAIIFLANTLSNRKAVTGSVIGGTETVTTITNQSSILPLDKPVVIEDTNQKLTTGVTPSDQDDVNVPVKKRILASVRPQTIFRSFSLNRQFLPKRADKASFFNFSESDNYMVYSDGDGNAVKLPKKLFSLVHCEDGDDGCKERIKQLQRKMASSATTTDFGGIIEILRQLQ